MRILYLMKTEDSNLGDLLINKLLINFLHENNHTLLFDTSGIRESFRDSVLSDISNPFIFSQKKNISYFIKLALGRTYFDAILTPPGHARKATIRDYVHILIAIYCRIIGVKYIRLGKSFPKNKTFGTLIEKTISFLAHHTMVRDKKSLNRVQVTNYQKNISCAPDLILLLEREEIRKQDKKNKLVASFRFSTYNEKERLNFTKKTSAFISHYSKKYNLEINLTWQVDQDEDCIKAIKSELNKIGIHPLLTKVTFKNFQEVYTSGSILVSNRLHVALTGLVLEANSWAVCDAIKDYKIIDAFEELNIQNRIISNDQDIELMSQSRPTLSKEIFNQKIKAAIINAIS